MRMLIHTSHVPSPRRTKRLQEGNRSRGTCPIGHHYRMLKEGIRWRDLGGIFFDELNKQAVVKRTIKRLEALGYKMTVELTTPAA